MALGRGGGVSAVGLALALLPGCELDRHAIAPPGARVTVVPEFVCSGEEVVVSWDAGEQTDSPACRPGLVGSGAGSEPSRSDCIFINRTSTPAQPVWDGTDDLDTQGSRTASIDVTTTFTATARQRVAEATESATVTVIEETEPPGPRELPFEFEGTCDGARATWKGVPLKDRTSGCLEVVAICNTHTDRIRLRDADEAGRETSLDPTECTEIFNGRAPNLAGAVEGFVPPVGACGAEVTTGGPAPFSILVRLQCNREMPTCAF